MRTNFDCEDTKFGTKGTSLKFDGTIISRNLRNCAITQTGHIENLNTLVINNATAADFVAKRARGAYISADFQPDATCAFSAIS